MRSSVERVNRELAHRREFIDLGLTNSESARARVRAGLDACCDAHRPSNTCSGLASPCVQLSSIRRRGRRAGLDCVPALSFCRRPA
ncbi:hypothetical protein ACFPRL_27905 [Pseudoclavibacter helvolus]